MMKATIDRVEGKMAVLLLGDEGTKLNIPLSQLPDGCKEGDILNMSFERDFVGTEQAKERVSALMEKLKKKGQGGTGIIRGPDV
jgi:hypothetical protein